MTDALRIRAFEEIGTSPFIPVPPPHLVRKVCGAELSAEEYRRSGLVVAGDIYNIFCAHRGGPRGITIADIGCGVGRTASFLPQLFPECRYIGFDVQGELIGWASGALTPRIPDLKFHLLGTETNYAGSKSFELPIEPETIELVVAASLFTHLDEAATAGYFREIRRILRHDGVAYLTYFSYDGEACRAYAKAAGERNGHTLSERGRCWLWGAEGIYDTFYREEDLHSLAHETGLRIADIRRGFWQRAPTNMDNPAAFQDLMVIRRDDFPAQTA